MRAFERLTTPTGRWLRSSVQTGGAVGPAVHNGPAAAAVLAAGLGVLALAGTNLVSALLQPAEEALILIGRFALPGGDLLVAYGGKEVVGLVCWLCGWLVLHQLLKRRQVSLTMTAAVFVVCLLVATGLFWPPLLGQLARLARVVRLA